MEIITVFVDDLCKAFNQPTINALQMLPIIINFIICEKPFTYWHIKSSEETKETSEVLKSSRYSM